MNDNFVSKNRVVGTILFIFSIMFMVFIFIYYEHTRENIELLKKDTQKGIESLYQEVSQSMLKKQLVVRADFMLNEINVEAKMEAIREQNREKIQKLFMVHFKTLKKQLKGFEIMHFYDKDGISILRMHNPKRYGDDLKSFRECIHTIIKAKKTTSFFEVGIHGLAYRHTVPIYDKGELLGFFELGVKPAILLTKAKRIFNLKGFIFIDNQYIPKEIIDQPFRVNGKYSICKVCDNNNKFIATMPQLNIDQDTLFEVPKHSYSIIKKDIQDAKGERIGSIVFFQDITAISNHVEDFIIESAFLFLIALLLSYIALNRYVTTIFKKLNKARFLLDNATDAVYVVNLKNGSIMDVNERASLMLGYTRRELLKKRVMEFRSPMPGDEPLDWQEHINKLKMEHFITSQGMHTRKDGTSFPVEANLSYIQDENEEYMIATARDITNKLKLEKKIQKETNEIKRLQDVISQSVLYTTSDLNGRITSISKAFEKFSGYKASEVIGKNHSILKDPNTSKDFYTSMWDKLLRNETFVGELKNYTKEGKAQWVKLTISPMFDEEGSKVGYSSYRENITDKKELEYISTHDTLTGVYNREYFQRELHKKISSAVRYNHSFGFVMLDIDHFKSVNDTYGHGVGDKVLQDLAQTVSSHIRKDDIFARWGGEEFIIIANGATMESLMGLIEKLQKELAKVSFAPVSKVSASFGLTLYKKGDTVESIQKRADDALYQAKRNGRNRYEVKL
ncbi:MAG: diguanylate cyclase [Campylobacterota bacterium]|nr:diguanylate cyclase [Campylobacterota bacterium]